MTTVISYIPELNRLQQPINNAVPPFTFQSNKSSVQPFSLATIPADGFVPLIGLATGSFISGISSPNIGDYNLINQRYSLQSYLGELSITLAIVDTISIPTIGGSNISYGTATLINPTFFSAFLPALLVASTTPNDFILSPGSNLLMSQIMTNNGINLTTGQVLYLGLYNNVGASPAIVTGLACDVEFLSRVDLAFSGNSSTPIANNNLATNQAATGGSVYSP